VSKRSQRTAIRAHLVLKSSMLFVEKLISFSLKFDDEKRVIWGHIKMVLTKKLLIFIHYFKYKNELNL